jgi:hypothetical protein
LYGSLQWRLRVKPAGIIASFWTIFRIRVRRARGGQTTAAAAGGAIFGDLYGAPPYKHYFVRGHHYFGSKQFVFLIPLCFIFIECWPFSSHFWLVPGPKKIVFLGILFTQNVVFSAYITGFLGAGPQNETP